MVDILREELNRRLNLESTAKINWEVTKQLQAEPKYVQFNKWCEDNGVVRDSVMYPTAFGKTGGLVGLSATRRVGFQEAYIYVPTKIIICEDQFRYDPKIGHILDLHPEAFQDRVSSEHLVIIFFVCCELMKGENSFWYPYFKITEKTDMLCYWKEEELNLLQDEIMKAEAMDEIEALQEEYEICFNIAKQYPELIPIKKFTFDLFMEAHTMVVTRCFGYSLPYLMMVPFADCANHHATDNQYELFHSKLSRLKKDASMTEEEKFYFTVDKKRLNFFKHFDNFEDKIEVPYKSARYAKKVQMRNEVTKLTTVDFMTREDYYDKDIWDLKYISTSDEEDNDSDMASEGGSESEESDDEKEEKGEKQEDMETLQGGDQLPHMFKTFNKKVRSGNAKGPPRVQYEYRYSNDPNEQMAKPRKTVVVRKRVDRKGPQNLIDVLIIQKLNMYEREERMRILKEHDDEDWQKMQTDYNSSEDDNVQGDATKQLLDDIENYSWYRWDDPNCYFTLATKHKNIIDIGQQIFHCYGRRTNRYLLGNYGFCLENNKYNSLSFRVWLDFNEASKSQSKPKSKKESDDEYDEEESEDDNKVQKVIRLKVHKIREDVFAYLRASLMQKYDKGIKEHLLVSTPVDPEFELLVVACAINLFQGLLTARFKTSAIEDQQLLNQEDLSVRQRFAIRHRLDCKTILESNIKILNILARILANIQIAIEESAQTGNKMTRMTYKQIYMQQVEMFESKSELLMNRIRIRKYVRELLLNQKRVMENIAKKGLAASSQQQYKQKNAATPVTQSQSSQSSQDVDQLEHDTAFWTTKTLDLEIKIETLTKERQLVKDNRMKDLRQKLLKAKLQVKHELETNQDLNEKVSTLTMREHEQGKLLRDLDSEMQVIQQKLVEYEQTTRQKEDQSKLQRAFLQIQQSSELTDLTVLALKVTEELNRAKANAALMKQ